MSMLNGIGSYDDIWKAVISPNKQEYTVYDLGPTDITVQGNKIQRTDFRLSNKRGYSIQCSFFQHVNINAPMPCVIYLHANGCSRLEALQYTDVVLSNQVSFFCFDFSGCGKSDGVYTSVGWYEQDDLECVIQYLYNTGKVTKLAVWGRSMGAATALMYAAKDPRISCLIFDSPFCTFKKLVKDLVKKKAPIPDFLLTGALQIIRTTIQKKANFDLNALRPIDYVDKISVPALFGAGKDDTFVSNKHTQDLYKAYGGHKQIMLFEGDHNTLRPMAWTKLVKEFIRFHLLGEKHESQVPKKSIKSLFNSAEEILEPNYDSLGLRKNVSQPANAHSHTHVSVPAPTNYSTVHTTNHPAVQQNNMNFSWLENAGLSSHQPQTVNHTPQNSTIPEKFIQRYGTEVKPENYHHHHHKAQPAEKKLNRLFSPHSPADQTSQISQISHNKSVQSYLNSSSHANQMQPGQGSPRLLSKGYADPTRSKPFDQPGKSQNNNRSTSEIQQNANFFGSRENKHNPASRFDNSLNQFDAPKVSVSLRDASNYHLNNTYESHPKDQKPKRKIFGPEHLQAKSPQSSTLPKTIATTDSTNHRRNSPTPQSAHHVQRRLDSQNARNRKIFDKGNDNSTSTSIYGMHPSSSFTTSVSSGSEHLSKKGLHVDVHSPVPHIPPAQSVPHGHNYSNPKMTSLEQLDHRRISDHYTAYPQYTNFEIKDHNMFQRNNGY